MQIPDIPPRIAVSQDGDVLIIQGPAQPVLFISRLTLPAFLSWPEETAIEKIDGVGASTIVACLEARAHFTVASERPLALRFELRNGLTVLYASEENSDDLVDPRIRSDIKVTPKRVSVQGSLFVEKFRLIRNSNTPRGGPNGHHTTEQNIVLRLRNALSKRTPSIPGHFNS